MSSINKTREHIVCGEYVSSYVSCVNNRLHTSQTNTWLYWPPCSVVQSGLFKCSASFRYLLAESNFRSNAPLHTQISRMCFQRAKRLQRRNSIPSLLSCFDIFCRHISYWYVFTIIEYIAEAFIDKHVYEMEGFVNMSNSVYSLALTHPSSWQFTLP